MARLVIFYIIFTFASFCIARAEEFTLTLDEAVILSLRNNRDILLKAKDIAKAKEKISQALADLFPTVDVTVSRTYTRGLYLKDLGQTSTQTTLKQYLYKGGKTTNTIGQSEYNLAVARALLDKEKSDLILKVKNAYYTLYLAEEFAVLNKSIFDNTKAHLDYLEARYQNGEASESEVLKIKEALSSVQEAYELSLNQVEAACAVLRNLLYLGEEIKIKPAVKFAYTPVEIAYDDAFLKAMQERPEIRQYEAQIKADKKAIEITKADTRPNIYASWDYYSRSTKSLTFSPTKDWQDYNVLGVTFSWPVFDGWLAKHQVKEAVINLKQAQLNKEKTLKNIALELKEAYLDLKDALSRLKAREAEIILYQDNLRGIQEKYNQGLSSSLEMEDVKVSAQVAEFNQTQMIYEYILAKEKFYKAMGGPARAGYL